MEKTLIAAWEQIENQQRIDESAKKKLALAPKKGKKLEEEGVGGPAGAGTGASSNTASSSDTIVKSGAAAVAPAKLGKKPAKVYENKNVALKKAPIKKIVIAKKITEGIGEIVAGMAANGDANAKRVADKAISNANSTIKEDELPADPEAPGAEDFFKSAASDENAEEGQEDGQEEESVDAETAEQVVDAIMKKYPTAIITLSISLPEDTVFDADVVAAAQEVANVNDEEPVDIESDPNLDGVPPENPEQDAKDELFEARKALVKQTRNKIKEMFVRMEGDEADGEEITGEELPQDASLDTEPVIDQPSDDVVVGDNKISLSLDQWGQVISTTDLLNIDAQPVDGEVADLEGTEGDDIDTEVEAGDEQIDELKTQVNYDTPSGKLEILKKIQKNDFAKDKKVDVGINKESLNESFNDELAGYAYALKKLIGE
jgi:hypothetical protein